MTERNQIAMETLLDQDRLLRVIANPNSAEAVQLLEQADRKRAATVGPEVHLRGLIEFSNCCRNNCLYCGLRRDNRELPRYRMSPMEIIAAAADGVRLGYQTIVLQSGEDPHFTKEVLTEIIREIKKLDVVVTLSVGEREPAEYESWREAGAERYLMRHETADPELYRKLHPGQDLTKRLYLLKFLKELDYQIGTGFMVGLPGQTPATLMADLKLARELEADMVGIGPFIPHHKTPLAAAQGGTVAQTCVMVALTRIFLPYALIPATTALGSIDPLGREAALQAGANVVMPNLTPLKYRADYQIYPNKICLGDDATTCHSCLGNRIAKIGRVVASDPGHNRLWQQKMDQSTGIEV